MPHETKKVIGLLGQKAFLAKMLPVLHNDCETLDSHLQQARWPEAQSKAHQLKSLFYLLEAGALLESLQHIEDNKLPLISTAEFRQQLQQQINRFCIEIEQHISD